jgi:hypothetical protein
MRCGGRKVQLKATREIGISGEGKALGDLGLAYTG